MTVKCSIFAKITKKQVLEFLSEMIHQQSIGDEMILLN